MTNLRQKNAFEIARAQFSLSSNRDGTYAERIRLYNVPRAGGSISARVSPSSDRTVDFHSELSVPIV